MIHETTGTTNPLTEEEIEAYKKAREEGQRYEQQVRQVAFARVRRPDGTLGEPGALPQDILIKTYLGQPLENKEVEELQNQQKEVQEAQKQTAESTT